MASCYSLKHWPRLLMQYPTQKRVLFAFGQGPHLDNARPYLARRCNVHLLLAQIWYIPRFPAPLSDTKVIVCEVLSPLPNSPMEFQQISSLQTSAFLVRPPPGCIHPWYDLSAHPGSLAKLGCFLP